jgi:glyoxylase-like metal-dependent hydrolase (beta-lactamase superfamily II)
LSGELSRLQPGEEFSLYSLVSILTVVRAAQMRVIPVPNQSDNYAYLLIDDASKTAAAVDPFDVPKVTAAAEKEHVQIVAGITTHHHGDHSGGNTEFVRYMCSIQSGRQVMHRPAVSSVSWYSYLCRFYHSTSGD